METSYLREITNKTSKLCDAVFVTKFETNLKNADIQEDTEDKPKLTALQKYRQKKKLAGLKKVKKE